ncbi:hypothetical protein OICFNHDK_0038 [Methylobacterium bullatum]|uniref:Uncharacterized protein n=1 Tax=Methylobacterium bullatum TaxID=570505 RepID=A0A679K2X9_9HYPH|nr:MULTISPECIES: hypothetical protein [Methylobacterium]GJD37601.1 hypothetical protein OICFNHDK_0038 [Methylobacterium bullatum]CAA2138458.1 hypothetical protein MBLL_01156 [Methylobacterium bullatum]
MSVEAAYLEAFKAVPGMSSDLASNAENPIRYGFEITDARGTILMVLPFAEVLDHGRKRSKQPSKLRFRKGRAEMRRTAGLIVELRDAQVKLNVTFAETQRLLDMAKGTRG